MKKLFMNISNWWMLTFRNTKIKVVKFDAYKVTFRRFTMDITTKSGNFKLRTMGMLYPNSFLYNALEQGDDKIVEWFCNEVYQFVTLITPDNGLVNDVHKAFAKFYKRMEKKAESIANDITPDEDKLNEEVVKANIEVAKMNKVKRRAHRVTMREVLTQEEN